MSKTTPRSLTSTVLARVARAPEPTAAAPVAATRPAPASVLRTSICVRIDSGMIERLRDAIASGATEDTFRDAVERGISLVLAELETDGPFPPRPRRRL